MFNPYYENYLAHHGIKGQRWGVRRYQPYPNGSSKKGKYVGDKELKKKEAIRSGSAKDIRKNFDSMSTYELRDATERARLRANLEEIENQQSALNKGTRTIKNIGGALTATVAAASAGFVLANGINKLSKVPNNVWQTAAIDLTKLSNPKLDKKGYEAIKKKMAFDKVLEEGAQVFKGGKKKK